MSGGLGTLPIWATDNKKNPLIQGPRQEASGLLGTSLKKAATFQKAILAQLDKQVVILCYRYGAQVTCILHNEKQMMIIVKNKTKIFQSFFNPFD